jgi:hypothetical protein
MFYAGFTLFLALTLALALLLSKPQVKEINHVLNAIKRKSTTYILASYSPKAMCLAPVCQDKVPFSSCRE